MKYCRKCGKELKDTVANCPACGSEVKKQNSLAEDAGTPAVTKQKTSQKKKRLLAVGIAAGVVLVACFALFMFKGFNKEEPPVWVDTRIAVSGICGDGVFWRLNLETGKMLIAGNGKVSYADETWQQHQSEIKEVVMEEGVRSVGSMVFSHCENLQIVILPDTLNTIDYRAFEGCASLSDVTFLGTEEQWDAVSVSDGNDSLTSILQCREEQCDRELTDFSVHSFSWGSGDIFEGMGVDIIYRCTPYHEDETIIFTNSIEEEMDFGASRYAEDKCLGNSINIPDDPTFEGWQWATITVNGRTVIIHFYLKYVASFSEYVGTEEWPEFAWEVTEWYIE